MRGGAVAEQLVWLDRRGEALLEEERTITVRVSEQNVEISWTTRLTAVADTVTFGSPQTNGRDGAFYGGLFWRTPFPSALVRTADGDGLDAAHGSTSPWLAVDSAGASLVAATTSGMPWFVRAEGYVGFGPAVAVTQRRELEQGESLRLDLAVAILDARSRGARGGRERAARRRSGLRCERAALRDLVAWADAADVAIHTLEVSVAGRVVARGGIPPFGLDAPHRMYSVSKSLTGLAVLLLAEEGRLRLTDGIAEHFPEMAPVHPWIEATRIDDILAMTGPHSRTTYDEAAGGWLESYFRVPPTHRPGTLFTYDTSGSYVLSALVERLSGMPLLEYLRPRLLDPLGVGTTARFLTGPEGISHGGSGLIMAPGDLLPIAEVLNGGGCRNGRARAVGERRRTAARKTQRSGDADVGRRAASRLRTPGLASRRRERG